MADIKWSAFPDGAAIESGDEVVGLRAGANTRMTANEFDTTISATGTITSSVEGFVSGNETPGGIGGYFKAFSTTANMGSNTFQAIDNSGDYANVLQNAATTDARTWTLPDATGTLSLTESAAGGSTTQIQYNNAGALAGDTGFTTDGAGTETIVGQLNVDNLRMDGSTLSTTTASDLQLTPLAGQELDINFSSSVIAGVQIRSAEATGNPRLLFYRSNTTSLGGIYSGLNDTFSGTGNNIYLQNPLAGGKIFLRDSTGNALAISAGNTTLSGSLTAGASSTILKNQDAGTELLISNATGGTASFSGVSWANNTSSSLMRLFASTYTGVVGWANRLVISQSTSIANGILIRSPAGGIQLTADGSTNTANLLVNASGNTFLSGSLTTSQTAGIIGTTTNNNANTGSVGEFVESVVAAGSAVGLTTATPANVTSISLTAGDWDVWGNVNFIDAATTNVTVAAASVGAASATVQENSTTQINWGPSGIVPEARIRLGTPALRVSVSGTTTIYLVALGNFSVDTLTAYGSISARRRR